MNYQLPVYIRRFKPVEILQFDPDSPLAYRDTTPKELVRDADDVVKLGKALYEAEQKAWEGRSASEIIETVIDGAMADLMKVAKYLEAVGTKEAKEEHQRIMMLIVRMKCPLVSCVMQCFESIYLQGGMAAVRESINKLTKKEES